MSSTPSSTANPFDTGLAAAQESFLSMLDPQQEQPADTEAEPPQIEAEAETEVVEMESDAQAHPDEVEDSEVDEFDEDGDAEIEVEPEVQTFTVRVNGEEIEVPLEELQKGYSRQSDYTLKTQQLAEQRRQAEAELSALNAERQQYANVLAGLQQQLESTTAEPDWEALRAADPSAYAVEWAAHQQRKEQLDAINQEQSRLHQIRQQQLVEQQQAHLQTEQAQLLDAIPEWRDETVARDEKLALVDYGRSIGFTDAELNNVTDHRSVLALRNAMRYDQLQSKAKSVKPVDQKPTLKPGSANRVPRRRTELQKAQTRLKKQGTTSAAAAVFEQMLNRG
jgi:hypothetical protein